MTKEMKKFLSLLLLFSLAYLLAASSTVAQDQPIYVVIINAANDEEVKRDAKTVDKMFMKKEKRWTNGERVVPVNQSDNSDVRIAFTEDIHLGKKVKAIEAFWQKQLFSGRDAPPEKMSNDEEVIIYVASNPGAVGYVSASAQLPDTVKILEIDMSTAKKK